VCGASNVLLGGNEIDCVCVYVCVREADQSILLRSADLHSFEARSLALFAEFP
jgi:hypothetical protein